MDELKPCPFCGSKAIIDQWPVSNKLYVRCSNGMCMMNHGTGLYDGNLRKHIRMWNRRAYRDMMKGTIDPVHAAGGCYCNECACWGYHGEGTVAPCRFIKMPTSSDDFCSHGERMDGDV